MAAWIACMAGGYLLASIPFGVLIASSQGVDIRTQGSKNIGATNVGRVLGRKWGLLCFFLDMSKGAAPVIVFGVLAGIYEKPLHETATDWWLWMAVAMACLLGHMYSMFLRGGGGKGVATAFGSLLGMWPLMTIAALMAFVGWIVIVLLTRMISLASVCAACLLPFGVLFQVYMESRAADGEPFSLRAEEASAAIVVSMLLALLVIWKHRGNLARIMKGTESKIGRSKSDPDNQ
ncbi:MAG: acyl-phosphate glycerol 3-phosphate acyltransferase [Phycisphaerae bacterium]|nr:acyl-phosphate glycerol 3-phosphate acyltransferase [Phycisphaerae bacterium]